MSVFACEIMKIQDIVMNAAVKEQAQTAFFEMKKATDLPYVKEQFLTFCKNQKLKNAIFASQILLKEGDYEGIWNVINDASKAGMERNIGHDYFGEFDARMSEMAREVVKTNWTMVDTHLAGGLGKGELGFIVAPAGSGKSWFLAKIGSEAFLQNKNVLHFTMELNEKYVGRRYDAIFSGIAFQDVGKKRDVIKKTLDEIHAKGCGKLYVKYFPTKAASAQTLKLHVERMQLITGIKFDLVIVDYADLLRPMQQERNLNSYQDAGNVYEELRGVAGELQVPVWTASQSNRGVHEENIIEAMGVADSYRKIMIGDFIMSLSRKKEDKMAGTGRIYIMKNRFGPDGIWYPVNFDTSIGKVEIFEKNSVEGEEVLSRVKSAEEQLKEIFGKRWREVHDDESNNGH